MLLEICANSIQSALNADAAGADRIELCSELSVGGITPSLGLVENVIRSVAIPVFVLVRPRSGDFCYSPEEFEIMKRDIDLFKGAGCSGIVSGVLQENHRIDVARTQELISLSAPLPFTFHRAFDCVPNPMAALEQLIGLGVHRILSSGSAATAEEGMEVLRRLQERAITNLIIMPGGGINPHNARKFKTAGFREIHSSASALISNQPLKFDFGPLQTRSDIQTIKALKKTLQ